MKRKTLTTALIISLFLLSACASSPLIKAIKDGDMNSFKAAIDKGADIHAPSGDLTPLMWAALEGRAAMIDYLLDKGAKINEQDRSGYAALHWAIYNIKAESTKALVNRGADINKPDLLGNKPIAFAAKYGNLEIVKYLLGKGADLNAKDDQGNTILIIAAVNGQSEIFQYLFNNEKMDINVRDKYGNTVLHLACMSAVSGSDSSAIIDMLLQSGVDKNAKNHLGDTPLILASLHGSFENAEALVKNGVDLEAKNNDGKTALLYAQDCSNNQQIDKKHTPYYWSLQPPNFTTNCGRIAGLIKKHQQK